MVVFFDLEGEDDDPYGHSSIPPHHRLQQRVHQLSQGLDVHKHDDYCQADDENEDTNGKLFGSALACYPVSLSIASHLDLNDLYALSMTSRKIHDSLSQFARYLRTGSLRCTNDLPPDTSEEEVDALVFQEAIDEVADVAPAQTEGPALPIRYNTSSSPVYAGAHHLLGRFNQCARDMVAPCRKCGVIVCRNCAVKPPSDRNLPNRFRRLCKTCLDAPFLDHLHALSDDQDIHDTPPASSASSAASVYSVSSMETGTHQPSFTSPVFLRQPCSCVSRGVYLCQPCGAKLNAADTTYKRVWTWRSRYSTHIGGGLGTGLGLGDQGQKCGRGEFCLERGVGGVCWVEIECSEARSQNHMEEDSFEVTHGHPLVIRDHHGEKIVVNKPGYLSQEMEGIGGVVKKKVKKRLKVGATVYEYDDERESSKYLARESSGKLRSWCGWCSRVCPGELDRAELVQFLGH